MSPKFIKAPEQEGAKALADRFNDELSKNQSVVWFLSGGSNVKISPQVMRLIETDLSSRLSVSLVDERYVPLDHDDSNWQQLVKAGFDFKRARALPVLKGQNLTATLKDYEKVVGELFKEADVVIGQLGIGSDGHIAGILPNSPAAVESEHLVATYKGADYSRLTLSFRALRQLSSAYVFSYGDNKREALERLKNQELDLTEQPAQILKDLSTVFIYNDQI